jgi:signal transduction histidine kinase
VAFVELIKNAHDADAQTCSLEVRPDSIVVSDDGHGMTLEEFKNGWMRVGTSAKAGQAQSRRYKRPVTGEKGIGRFAVRFLGGVLSLRTIADDPKRKRRTVLEANFNWTAVDQNEDLGSVAVPYTLRSAAAGETLGTQLEITALRRDTGSINWDEIRTGSISLLSPVRALYTRTAAVPADDARHTGPLEQDPGFSVRIRDVEASEDEPEDVATRILESYVLRAVAKLNANRLELDIYTRPDNPGNAGSPELSIHDTFPNELGTLTAEIRFYPKRKGTFAGLPVDGRRALGWVVRNSGVAIYDRSFRVLPYGTPGDDWLMTARDTARRHRKPRSKIAQRHFPMTEPELRSTELNYMLRLPHPQQLIGVVLVESARASRSNEGTGLIPSADREGFVDNDAFRQLEDLIRGAVEAIAFVDRKLQKQAEDVTRLELVQRLRRETQEAIAEIRANPRLRPEDRERIVEQFARAQVAVEQHEATARKREQQLEVLSLLGVVAGFMTHEFGVALDALQQSRTKLLDAAKLQPTFNEHAKQIEKHIASLKDFAAYSRAYIGASPEPPAKPYPARPRIQQVVRIFGEYAADRDIAIEVSIERDLLAPRVPVALYNGVSLNLYTNALKAISAKADDQNRRISFRAWNEGRIHVLLVADTGVGIPSSFRERIFEPLVTTTAANAGPLGSGLGLGLTLVRRAVESFGGKVRVVDPPPGFSTAIEVRLPIARE